MTFGQQLMRVRDERNDITELKQKYAELADLLDDLRNKESNPEIKRLASTAITELQKSKYFAVDALSLTMGV